MTHTEIMAMLAEAEIPVAYDHYAEGESPDPPFICFRIPGTDHFSADGRVYYMIAQVNVELYTDQKDPELETRIEDIERTGDRLPNEFLSIFGKPDELAIFASLDI